ncbi:MAG: M48 family metallopeptidase [Acidobacteriia bacterium]|nr:M48 family metallopeptidase [Terriglobia bacterium]
MTNVIPMKPATLILFLLTCISFQAQTVPDKATNAPSVIASPTSPAPTTAYTLPPEKLAQAKALYTLRVRLLIAGTVWNFLLLLGILYSGLAARFRDWAEAVSRWRFVQAVTAVPLLLLTMTALQLPLSIYQHRVSLQYGLSVQGWGSWINDLLKGEAVVLAAMIPLLWLLLTLIRWSPRRWWFYAWLISLPLMVLVIFLVPLVLDPMFNDFQPLQASQPQLVEALEKVVQRGGLDIPRKRMYEMDASKKVTTLNAYVTGLGASKRVVVWDTTIQKMSQPETLFVFGHEMGHYVLNHIYKGLLLAAVLSFFCFYLFYRLAGWMLRRFQTRWQLRGLDDWAALSMLFLLFVALEFVGQPLASAYSRHLEHQADIYGLEVTHGINPDSQEAAARAFQTLGEQSLSYPTPGAWMVFWYYDHPPIADRVKFAHEYDPWSKGEHPEFVK